MNRNRIQNKRRNRGFTLVESLVAIAIMAVSIAAPLTAAYQGVSYTNLARDQITAAYLAQDAIEYIRTVKIQNAINGLDWLYGLDSCSNPGGCRIDTLAKTVTAACSGTCQKLDYNTASGRYGYQTGSGWTPSKFTRTVEMINMVHPGGSDYDESRIEVTVSWRSSLLTKSITVRTNLYDSIF